LLDLRHELALAGTDVESFYFGPNDWPTRNRMFTLIQGLPLVFDAIVLHKRKAYPWVAAKQDRLFGPLIVLSCDVLEE